MHARRHTRASAILALLVTLATIAPSRPVRAGCNPDPSMLTTISTVFILMPLTGLGIGGLAYRQGYIRENLVALSGDIAVGGGVHLRDAAQLYQLTDRETARFLDAVRAHRPTLLRMSHQPPTRAAIALEQALAGLATHARHHT